MIDHDQAPSLLALSGDALMTPRDTEIAFWSALGAGADGLALRVRLTADGVPVCVSEANLAATTGVDRAIAEVSAAELARLDAGSEFRSVALDADNRATDRRGGDYPWRAKAGPDALSHPTLWDTLVRFGRRAELLIYLLDDLGADAHQRVVDTVARAGLLRRVTFVGDDEALGRVPSQAPTALVTATPLADLGRALERGITRLVTPHGVAFPDGASPDPALMRALASAGVALIPEFDDAQPAPPPSLHALWRSSPIVALIAPGVLATAEQLNPPALLIEDDFAGTRIDRSIWTAGYSHQNKDTRIHQSDGLHIVIESGAEGSYSGAAAVCHIPVHGEFDARVEFHVARPHQGTTFELAAIGVDPGYFHIDNSDLDSRRVNLTFDVHGAPPYASSERDEDDGFRCGWNNGFNLARIDQDWVADSVNMFNKYGRDVGNGSPERKHGELRLVRHGSVFATYYRDTDNPAWVCSGAMLVHNLAAEVFVRLAAKHWKKSNPKPPNNHVVFRNFRLYQR